jgi:hypothetical protein
LRFSSFVPSKRISYHKNRYEVSALMGELDEGGVDTLMAVVGELAAQGRGN